MENQPGMNLGSEAGIEELTLEEQRQKAIDAARKHLRDALLEGSVLSAGAVIARCFKTYLATQERKKHEAALVFAELILKDQNAKLTNEQFVSLMEDLVSID